MIAKKLVDAQYLANARADGYAGYQAMQKAHETHDVKAFMRAHKMAARARQRLVAWGNNNAAPWIERK